MTFRIYGDSAILINFEQKIEEAINEQVINLTRLIELAALPTVRYCIPAYCSLTVGYDALATDYDELVEQIKQLSKGLTEEQNPGSGRKLKIPVCYEKPYAMDFSELCEKSGLSQEEIVKLHTGLSFRVYMLGFLPGFVYMGKLPKELYCPRKSNPRLRVPANSVGVAGFQTGIYPSIAPGGWQIIGRTPLKIFDGTKKNPFLFQAGDQVQFSAISKSDFAQIEEDLITGKYDLDSIYKL